MITTMLLGSWLAAGQAPAPAPMPMPKPMAAPMTAPAAPAADCATCAAEPEEEATKYFVQKLLEGTRFGQTLDCRGVTLSGWAAMNYTASSTSRSNAPVFFNDFANDFQLNQVWLQAVKSIDTSKKERQFGYNVSGFYGRDYQFTLPRGLFSDQAADARNYGFDLVYHYGEVFLPNLGGEGTTVRVGRWGTHCGYEVIDAVNTPFVSKSYNFQYNPFTHTGVNFYSQINESWSMQNGVVTGSDVWIDPAARATYIGSLKYAPKDGKGSIAFNTVIGTAEFLANENFTHYNVFNMVGTYNVSDKLTYVLDATFSHADNFTGVGSAHWYGFANYFLYKINDKVASNLRVELFEDTKGVRTGFAGLYTAATWGLNVTPNDWAILRPFVRYDYNSETRPFEGDPDLFTGGIELIIRY